MGAAERGILWTDKEMDALLQIWKNDYIKSQLSTTHRNSKVYKTERERIQPDHLAGFNWKNYLATWDKLRSSGQPGNVKWPLYDVLDRILTLFLKETRSKTPLLLKWSNKWDLSQGHGQCKHEKKKNRSFFSWFTSWSTLRGLGSVLLKWTKVYVVA